MKKFISVFTIITIMFTLICNTVFASDVSNSDITSDTNIVSDTDNIPATYIEDENNVQNILCPEDEWEEVEYEYYEWKDEEIEPPVIDDEEDDHVYDSYFPITEPTFEGLCVINIDYNYDFTYIEFNDGSWGAIGDGHYIFQPVIMGNYSYEFTYDDTCYPVNEFVGCILTYADNMYGNNLDYIPDGNGTDIMLLAFSAEDVDAYEKHIGEMKEMEIGAEG